MTPSNVFWHLKMLKSTPKCHELTLDVLKVNIFRFKMQNDLTWSYNLMTKKLSASQKKAQNRPLGNYRVRPNSGNSGSHLAHPPAAPNSRKCPRPQMVNCVY
jgi:hypothetical protein